MDLVYRTLLRQWNASPNDRELSQKLDNLIEAMGTSPRLINTHRALNIRAVAKEIKTHFGTLGLPTLYYTRLQQLDSPEARLYCDTINQAIMLVDYFSTINPGEHAIQSQIDALTYPIFLLMSDLGLYGPRSTALLSSRHLSCAICGRTDVEIYGGLCESPTCNEEAMRIAAETPYPGQRRRLSLAHYHAYRENLVLCGWRAIEYSIAHGVPIQDAPMPDNIYNNTWHTPDCLPPGVVPLAEASLSSFHDWCYRLFDPRAFYSAVLLSGCDGRSGGRGRGCRQHHRGCICIRLCACQHCEGCEMHAPECVCEEFGSASFGPLAVNIHPLGYLCGCRGSGWSGTDYDTVHKCPAHRVTTHHPECDSNYYDEGAPIEQCFCNPERVEPPEPPCVAL